MNSSRNVLKKSTIAAALVAAIQTTVVGTAFGSDVVNGGTFDPEAWIQGIVDTLGFGTVVQLDTGTFLAAGVRDSGSMEVDVTVDSGDGSGSTSYGPFFFTTQLK